MVITANDFHKTYTASRYSGTIQVEARIDKQAAWQDIVTAPRDGQWFWATNKKGRIYCAYWCTKRHCFIHTRMKLRVNPTHWKWNYP